MTERAVRDLPALDGQELERYGRHLVIPQVGPDGQRRLKAARVLLVGAGGLGSPAALYLAAAGVGRLTIVDHDTVDRSNLQRQLLHGEADVGRLKVESARDRLRDVNPHVAVDVHATRLTAANALDVVRGHDLVLDGSDNFATRYLVNDACVLAGVPNVYASVQRFEGQASVFAAPGGPCYRCLFPEPPPPDLVPNCAEAGVLGVLPGLLGTIQATEALKLLLGVGEPLVGRLLLVDALAMRLRTIAIPRDPNCPACGTRELRALVDYDAWCAGPGRAAATGAPAEAAPAEAPVEEIAPAKLAAGLAAGAPLVLLDVREPNEWAAARIPGARLVPLGTLDAALATLDPRADVVVHCQSGVRSALAARRLRAAGFTRVRSLTGGIARWHAEVGRTDRPAVNEAVPAC